MNIDSEFLKKTLVGLTGIDSPSGYCDKAIAYVGESRFARIQIRRY